MSGIRGQTLAHLDKALDDKSSPLSSGTKSNKQPKQKSISSPTSSSTAAAHPSTAPAVPHDLEEEKANNNNKRSLFSSKKTSSTSSHQSSITTKARGLLHSSSSSSKHHNNNKDKEQKDLSRMISTSLMTTGVLLGTPGGAGDVGEDQGRIRSSSSASQQSVKSDKSFSNKNNYIVVEDRSATTPLNHSMNNNASSFSSSTSSSLPPQQSQQLQQQQQSNHSHSHHHHIRLPSLPLHTPSFLKRRKHNTGSLDSPSSSSSSLPRPSSLQKPTTVPHPHHTILMVPQHDIHITYSHSVPTQNVFIAGTWTVPGYQPWDKLPMTFNPETNSFEIVLNCQELEDISDYLDDDGYLHHELLDHPDNEIHSSDAQNTTSPTSTTSSLSKRQRIRRFFGRARSSSSASTTSSHSTTNNTHSHEDTAYHHQCKDGGVPLPLTKEYRYQYKFLVDGEWHCDPNKPTVHDGHGHWNHELVAVLMEQFPSASTVGDNETLANRSRSSSIQSITSASVVSSVYSKPLPLPVVEVSELQGESTVEKEQKISAAVPESAGKTSIVAAAVEVAAPVVATQRSAKSRDTYEAILLFEERDDLSDGEGRSKDQYLIGSDDEHDDTLDEKNEHGPEAPVLDDEQNHSFGHAAEEKNEKPMEGEEKERNIDQDINCSPKEAVVGVAAVADAMSDSVIEGSLVESVEKETVEEKADEKKEELVDVESQSPSEEKSEVVKIDPLAVATAEATTAATTAFVLMEAVDPETHSRIASSSTLAEEEEEQEEEEQVQEPRPSMQIVTTSPVVHYAQVPSPPLTPLGLSSKDAETEETPTGMLSPQSEDGDGKMGSKELLTAASFTGTMLTPRAETSPFTRISDEEESRRSSEESATIDEIQEKQEPQSQYVLQRRTTVEQEEKKYETFDVLNDHSSFKSSESSSSLWSAVGSTVDSQASQEEHGRRPRELPEPDKYPNLLWSFCKTTAVVSAAVVVIGLGLGRKRD